MDTFRILIVEDELPAANRLEKMLAEVAPQAEIMAVMDSVESTVAFLGKGPAPDLILMDIQLADGVSFDIFHEVQVNTPVIFITAYDQYAIQAFKVNSVDYLLKPIKQEELSLAFEKYYRNRHQTGDKPDYKELVGVFRTKEYQKRFLIHIGQHIKTLEIAEAAYFFIQSKITIMVTFDGHQHPIDPNMDQLEEILDPSHFFRVNRQYIIHYPAIKQMYAHTKSRVIIETKPSAPGEVVVSADRAPEFKRWLMGKHPENEG